MHGPDVSEHENAQYMAIVVSLLCENSPQTSYDSSSVLASSILPCFCQCLSLAPGLLLIPHLAFHPIFLSVYDSAQTLASTN